MDPHRSTALACPVCKRPVPRAVQHRRHASGGTGGDGGGATTAGGELGVLVIAHSRSESPTPELGGDLPVPSEGRQASSVRCDDDVDRLHSRQAAGGGGDPALSSCEMVEVSIAQDNSAHVDVYASAGDGSRRLRLSGCS